MLKQIKNKIDNKIIQFDKFLDIREIARWISDDNCIYFYIYNHLKEESKNKLDDYLFKKYNLVFNKEKFLFSKQKENE